MLHRLSENVFVIIEEGEAPVRRGNPRYGAGLFNYLEQPRRLQTIPDHFRCQDL
jgi:hypothetical protein